MASTRPCRSPRWVPRTATSSTWRRSLPTGRVRKLASASHSRGYLAPGRQHVGRARLLWLAPRRYG
ncbi:hypothetical protein RHECNPAF_850015 [Rhizobium etli CNPAF512]|nr:hypothetical protein RHECNPAF_850015 [Rhizobium etli CNPAF512]